MKGNDPANIRDILHKLARTTPLGRVLDEARIWEHWPAIAGQQLAGHGRPVGVKDKVLKVAADDTAWMNTFAYCKWEIIRRINRLAGREMISDIFLLLAAEAEDDAPPPKKRGERPRKPKA